MNREANLNGNPIDYALRQRGTGLEFLYNKTTINISHYLKMSKDAPKYYLLQQR